MSGLLRDQVVRPAAGCRVRVDGRMATIVTVHDAVDTDTGELTPHARCVIVAPKTDPLFVDTTITDPTTVEPPLSPVLTARSLYAWAAKKRGVFTSTEHDAISAAETLLGLDRWAA